MDSDHNDDWKEESKGEQEGLNQYGYEEYDDEMDNDDQEEEEDVDLETLLQRQKQSMSLTQGGGSLKISLPVFEPQT